ncbi:MAG TPA: response regulator transcription factor [Solimonas sp.]|nr:response regulator transcription factor [Solimonas sp.]
MNTLRTLLIDDNRAFVVLARHLLAGSPVSVIGEGYDGYDAVRLAEELHPDLIIMDLAMPGMGGLQATRLIKAQDNPPRVVIASHYDDAAHREFAAQSGADGFINKQDYEHNLAQLLGQFAQQGAAHV